MNSLTNQGGKGMIQRHSVLCFSVIVKATCNRQAVMSYDSSVSSYHCIPKKKVSEHT